MTRPTPPGCIRRRSPIHDLPEMSTPDEPEAPRPKAWWADDGQDDGRDEPLPGDDTDGPCPGVLWRDVP